jgi:hypothetical protein
MAIKLPEGERDAPRHGRSRALLLINRKEAQMRISGLPKRVYLWINTQMYTLGDVLFGVGISVLAGFVVEIFSGRFSQSIANMLLFAITAIFVGAKLRERNKKCQ